MTDEILLDFEGDLPAPPEMQVVESEVEFLQSATSSKPMLIRGAKLCTWAEDFYALRGIPVRRVESPSAVLRQIYPALSAEQAQELAHKVGKTLLAAEECTPPELLAFCYPQNTRVWYGAPSPKHAAEWLVWLLEHSPTPAEQVILNHFADAIRAKGVQSDLIPLYAATTSEQAKELLCGWLGGGVSPRTILGEFPLEKDYSPVLKQVIRVEWNKQIIKSGGAFFVERLSFPLPLSWRRELAHLTAEFLERNPQALTACTLKTLRPYLREQTLQVLEKALPPSEPSAMPHQEGQVLVWFEREYLPYRRWQSNFGDESARRIVVKNAQTFAQWVLDRYPHWLLEGNWLSFQKSAHLSKSGKNEIVFCVILDGLPAWDAADLAKKISEEIPRLTLINQSFCFAPIPTITEFSKEALLKGTQPSYAEDLNPLGEILPDRTSPKNVFDKIRQGGLWFWRVEQPDKAYHFSHSDKRQLEVQKELNAIVDEIKEVVSIVQETYQLQVILTSDHGRLLNPKSPRRLNVPEGMQAHGRVAWGELNYIFPECGYVLDESKEWVELFHERYGLQTDLRIAWDEDSFLAMNNAGGDEAHPHGGLFPEEMIVPWFVYMRDAQIPQPEIVVTGAGEAESSGELHVSIVNQSQLTLECLEIRLSHGVTVAGNWAISPLNEISFSSSISPWPKRSDQDALKVTLLFRQPTGILFQCEVTPKLEIQSLYERRDDLFEDLEL